MLQHGAAQSVTCQLSSCKPSREAKRTPCGRIRLTCGSAPQVARGRLGDLAALRDRDTAPDKRARIRFGEHLGKVVSTAARASTAYRYAWAAPNRPKYACQSQQKRPGWMNLCSGLHQRTSSNTTGRSSYKYPWALGCASTFLLGVRQPQHLVTLWAAFIAHHTCANYEAWRITRSPPVLPLQSLVCAHTRQHQLAFASMGQARRTSPLACSHQARCQNLAGAV